MIVLMWMLLVAVDRVPSVSGHQSSLVSPVNVRISLRRHRYVVHWEAGPGAPAGVRYSVQTCALSTSPLWMSVVGCEAVFAPLECDVTEVFSSIEETYYTNVTAHLDSLTLSPASAKVMSSHSSLSAFIPSKDIKPEPPLVSLSFCNQSLLCTRLQPPADWLTDLYRNYKYKLNISTQRGRKHLVTVDAGISGYNLTDVVPGREYCVSVSISEHTHTQSKPQCITASTYFNTDALVSGMVCVLVVMCVASVPVLVYSGFLCLRPLLPSILVDFLPSPHLPLLLRMEDPALSLISMVTQARWRREKAKESEDEEEEEEWNEGRGGGYETRLQSGSSSPSPSSESPTATTALPMDTALLPPDTTEYSRNYSGSMRTPSLAETGTAGERALETDREREMNRNREIEREMDREGEGERSKGDGGMERKEEEEEREVDLFSVMLGDRDGEMKKEEEEEREVDFFSVTLGDRDGEMKKEEEEEEREVDFFSVTLGDRDGEMKKEEEEEEREVNLFSVTLGGKKAKEERTEDVCEVRDTYTLTHTPGGDTTHSSSEEEEEEEEEEECSGYMRRS